MWFGLCWFGGLCLVCYGMSWCVPFMFVLSSFVLCCCVSVVCCCVVGVVCVAFVRVMCVVMCCLRCVLFCLMWYALI